MLRSLSARRILVYGLVQGVGFRPFLHRIATRHSVNGRVRNRNDCVEVVAESSIDLIRQFVNALEHEAPPLSKITNIEISEIQPAGFTDFQIDRSRSSSDSVTRVAPDTAVCNDCLEDMQQQPQRRRYAFTNCTNCGPRFTIIRSLPYDRPGTTMAPFTMCSACRSEYEDIADRRYHAQPNACRECGPTYSLSERSTEKVTALTDSGAIDRAATIIDAGGIVAVKGIGGYHLACDAARQKTVLALRTAKRREGKPFAVMCRNLETASHIALLTKEEEDLLASPRAPITLVQRRESPLVAPAVTTGLDTIGIMLPYAPVHHILFETLRTPVLVMTSGNLSDEPIATSNEDSFARLMPICDALLHHNRDIHNRADDSIATLVRGSVRILRRSRGWVPEPISFDTSVEGIAAVGGELKNVFCIGKGSEAILSQHIGDLKIPETRTFFEESFDRLCSLFRFTPSLVACDLHPDYLSTHFGRSTGLPVVPVQHHHAHIAAVMAEHHVDGRVIGVSFDGTGYGEDGNTWGGEFLVASRSSFQRFAHIAYIPLPGGDAAIADPWKIALSLAQETLGKEAIPYEFFRSIHEDDMALTLAMIEKRFNTPLSSGIGRLFDGVAALTGIANHTSFEAEGPMRLEAALASGWENARPYHFELSAPVDGKSREILWDEPITSVVADLRSGATIADISARFHEGLAELVARVCQSASDEFGIATVALGGGVFQNRHLAARTEQLLEDNGFTVLVPHEVPANDGGLCLGQLAVAAATR